VVASYARRSLSNVHVERNRFAAFSGLAVRYLIAISTPTLKDEYLAGLWRKTIAHDLAWTVKHGVHPHGTLQANIPSWTWMSLPLGVEMVVATNVETSSHFHLTTESKVFTDTTELEVISKGAKVKVLGITGRLRPLIVDPETARVPWEAIERLGGYDFSINPAQPVYARNETGCLLVYEAPKEEIVGQLDYVVPDMWPGNPASTVEVEEGLERQLYCLEIGAKAMLFIQRLGEGTNTFRRVGASVGYATDFFHGFPVERLELV